MLPNSDPMVKDFDYIINNIPATETLYIDIENLTTDQKLFEQIADNFFNEINTAPYFPGIVYKFPHDSFLNLLNLVSANRLSLLDKSDLTAIDSQLTPKLISEHLIGIKRKLLSPSGMFMADALVEDPLNINELILSKLNAFKKETFGIKIEGSRLYSKDGTHLLMMATPKVSALNTRESVKMIKFLNDTRDKITKEYKNKVHIRFSGSHAATLDNSQTIQKDVKRAVFVLSAGIFIIGILFFRKMIHVFFIFLPTLVSLAFAAAFLSLIYHNISAIALGCGTILLGITVDFGIHILFNVDHSKVLNSESVITRLKLPIAAGACTTITAFSCLLFSSLPGQRQMGIFSIIGIFGAAFFALFLLKYFIPPFKIHQRQPIISLVGICDRLMSFRQNHINLIIFASMTLVTIGMFGIKDFKFEGDISKLNHLQPVTKSDMDNFLETWGGFSPALVLVKAGTLETALQKNDMLFELLKKMQRKEMIDQVASLSDILPSSKKRDNNYQNFLSIMTEDRIKKVEQMFRNASNQTGFKKEAFTPFFDSLKQDRAVFSIKDFDNTALKKLIDSKVVFKDKDVLILTTLNIKNKSLTPDIIKTIKSEIDGSMFLDKKYFINKMTSHVSKEFKQLFIFAAISMILVLFVFFRNIKIVLIIICPVFLSAFITAGILGLTNIPINLISMIFIIFVFGVGVDFSIFLMNHELRKIDNESNVTAGAVILCAMTTTGAFACLALAKHAALFSIGIAGLTGMITSLILALMLIPSLTQKFINQNDKRRFNG
ncbi:MAG: MMPL family transporter [Desulfobacula sp.]|nr:MMPL family transporter [Desulfobacula sp.]